MANRKPLLPHQTPDLYLTDGGLETTLVFLEGFDLPYFAAFDLLKNEEGYEAIRHYYMRYLQVASRFKAGFVLESPTWRANPDWLAKIGYPAPAINAINEKAIAMMVELKKDFEQEIEHIVISGCIGPRGDGYKPESIMTAAEAQQYHATQVAAFNRTPVDVITAITINYAEEAMGILRAANAVGLPVVIAFTVETDGRLPTGMTLKEAIEQVDNSDSKPPIYYMINCAHPTHFLPELEKGVGQPWIQRIKGIRANASRKSHAELDEATELDSGQPKELAHAYGVLKSKFSQLNVWGGCCGTDDRHVQEIARQVATLKV